MIHILSWTTKKLQKNTFQATTFKDEENSRTFQGKMEFKDFARTSPKIQGLFKTVRTLKEYYCDMRDLLERWRCEPD